MYEIEFKGKIYRVRFRHKRNKVKSKLNSKGGETTAYIKENDKAVLKAKARCSERDTFSKKLGRKIAFGRLIKASRGKK